MKKTHVLLFSLFATTTTFSQEVISSQGDTYTGASGVVDFTLGEVVINTVSTANNDVTQGFHQTYWNFAGVENLDPDFEASVYPNPMETQLTVTVANYTSVRYEMFDASGKIVCSANLTDEITQIEVIDFAPGSYQLSLIGQDDQILKNFKLIKTQIK